MDCRHNTDRRFAVQRLPDDRWRRATEANLAADHVAGYDLWTRAFVDGRAGWEDFAEVLHRGDTDELAELAARGRGESLAFLVMMLTGACNADCPICFTDRRRKPGEMTPAQRDALVRQAAELGASYVYVPGEGEPTIDWGWWDFLDSCRDAGVEAVVFTNGLVFSDPVTSRKYWDCEPDETVERLRDYPVSLYVKMWSTEPALVGEMMGIDASKYRFTTHDGVGTPEGMVRLLEGLPRERLGIEVVVERRNADEVVERIVPFAERHGLAQIVEMIQHNGRTLGNASYDPSPEQAAAATPYLSPTSCTAATCKAVVTSRGLLSPRIAILEGQLPRPARHVDEGALWDLLHGTDYLVQRRYELSCLCESEAAALADTGVELRGPTSVVPPSLSAAVGEHERTPVGAAVGAAAGNGSGSAPAAEARGGGSGWGPADAEAAEAESEAVDASVGDLAAGRVAHGTAVRVLGRAQPAGPGVTRLADGPSSITATGPDVPAFAWMSLTGRWDAVACLLRFDDTSMVAQPQRQPLGDAVPEFEHAREPDRLQAVVDRARLVDRLRDTLRADGFVEATTPMLAANAEMCDVNQAVTEPVGGRRFYLRTDPEEYLKRYLTAGLPAVYEVSTNVRDDDVDAWHLVEFQSLEYYRRSMTFDESVTLADRLVREAVRAVAPGEVTWQGVRFPTDAPVLRMPFAELFWATTGIDVGAPEVATADGLATALRDAGLDVEVSGELAGWRRSWLDEALDRYVLPRLRQPAWVTRFPADLAMSARLDPDDERFALRAELYLPGGLELAHVYENLTDGSEVRRRYERRRRHRVAGGLSHVPTNEHLMASAEAGMPPMAGGAIGVDRLLMVARGEEEVGRGLLFAREGFPRAVPARGGGCGGCAGGGACGCAGGGH